MKKVWIWLITLILLSIAAFAYWSQVITLITETGKYEKITIASWEATVFGFSRQIDNIEFSKDSGFTIRTLEWGTWKDLSASITDYSPITWILARNISDWDLVITATYADVTSIEKTIFQKSLKAGWNLISPAYKNDINGLVKTKTALWDSLPYSQVLDFTWNGFVYSGENLITTPNHDLNNTNYQIKTKSEIENTSLIEKLAYGLFINIDSVISGSQKMTSDDSEFIYSGENEICDEVSQLLGLCGEQFNYYISEANALASKWIIKDNSNNVIKYYVNNNIDRAEIAVLTRWLAWVERVECSNMFVDVDSNLTTDSDIFNFQDIFVCNSVEALANNWLINTNTNYYPGYFLTKAEAVWMIVKATYWDAYSFDSNNTDSWQKQVVNFAAAKWLMSGFSDYDTNATRWFVFWLANQALNEINTVETCDEVSELLGLCIIENTWTDSTNTWTILQVPTNLQATNISTSTINLTWDSIENATNYTVTYWTGDLNIEWSNKNDITSTWTILDYNGEWLASWATYNIKIKAFSGVVESEYSNEIQVTTFKTWTADLNFNDSIQTQNVLLGSNSIELANFSLFVQNEDLEVKTIKFNAWTKDFSSTFKNINLSDENWIIATGAVEDYDWTKTLITFNNGFNISKWSHTLRLITDTEIYTESWSLSALIWDSKIAFDFNSYDIKWVNTKNSITINSTVWINWKTINFTPVIVNAFVIDQLGTDDKYAKIRFNVDMGNNILDDDDITITTVNVETASASGIIVRNNDNETLNTGATTATITITDALSTNADLTVVTGDLYEFKASTGNEIKISKNGIDFDINLRTGTKHYKSDNDSVLNLGKYTIN